MTTSGCNDAILAVEGDLQAFARLRQQPEEVLVACASQLPTLVLTKTAVSRVLGALLSQEITPSQAQQWASFIFWSSPIQSKIEWQEDSEDDDSIAQAIHRMEEIGDIIDGELLPAEIRDLLAGLAGS